MEQPIASASLEARAPPAACEICQFPPWEAEWFIARHSHQRIQRSAEGGCFGCQLFHSILETTPPDTRSSFSIHCLVSLGTFSLTLYRRHGSRLVDVFMLPGTDPLPNLRIGRLPPRTTQLDVNLVNIRTWLRRCEADHPRCGESSSYVPPRLLEIASGRPDTVRVVDSGGPGEAQRLAPGVRYACLSHCWGATVVPRMARRGGLAANRAGISISELPKTFRDAVQVARALRIDYLWIDSLCVVQDDPADWELHVRAMADIYRNAFITLGAGDSVDGEGGFFREAHADSVEPRSLTYADEDGREFTIYHRPLILHPDQSGCTLSPLLQRGWVFQERLLSRRFLCFAGEEVQWECLEDVACSCSMTEGGFNWQARGKQSSPGFPKSPATKFDFARLGELEPQEISTLWREMVAQYSERRLTVPGDKLPALAGLSEVFRQARPDIYLEGLWHSTMEHDLTWHIARHGEGQSEGRSRPDATWSWAAACPGSVQWALDITDYSFKVRDVADKRLRVSGHLYPIILKVTEEADEPMAPLRRRCLVYRWLDREPSSTSDREASRNILRGARRLDVTGGGREYSHILPITWPTFGIRNTQLNNAIFYADYKFWGGEGELHDKHLPNLSLFCLGKMEKRDVPFGHPPGEFGWAFGLVIRARASEADGMLYERVGALFFHTGKRGSEWEPEGLSGTITIL